MTQRSHRRDFLKTTAALAGATMPYWVTSAQNRALGHTLVADRHVLGCIGTGDRWHQVVPGALNHSDCVAVCDVDRKHVERGKEKVTDIQGKKGKDIPVETYEDYRKLLDRKDIDVVTIVTPDHWHSKIAIDAMRAGKDVYCEKPLTLTIHEGKQIRKVLQETKRVFQVGTQQRSEMGLNFLKAVAMIKQGRIGQVKRVICDIGGSTDSGAIAEADVPDGLNWEMWLGQAPKVAYRSSTEAKTSNKAYPASRCHYEFRWWYEYSGGKMTDWGAHHVDIASWALGIDETGPLTLEGTAKHPCEMKDGVPQCDDRYNAAVEFDVTVMCPGGVEMHIVSNSPDGNGILFEGTEGRFHVSRGRMKGGAVDALADKPITEEDLMKLYKGKKPGNHMGNFFECIADRTDPISDVYSHHRAMTTCHLANIAIRLGRKITWDAEKEQIVGDSAANQWLSREQRKGYEIDVIV
jgi:predicted dehydrogenase